MLLIVMPYRAKTTIGNGVDSGNDPFFNNVVSLLHFDGTTYIDQISGNSWAASGNAALSSSAAKFGAKSLAVPATARSMISCTNTSFTMGTKADFTIEAFVYLNSTTGYHVLHSSADSSTFEFAVVDGVLQVYVSGAWNSLGGTTIASGSWYHIAVSRHGGMVFGFVNGTLCPNRVVYTGQVCSGNAISIGAQPGGAQFLCLDGYIDDYRFTKGIARYTTAFIVPGTAAPDALESGIDLLWDSTQVLVQVDADSTTLVDRSSFARNITNNGASIASIGDGASIRVGASADAGFSLPGNIHLGNGDFTLEFTCNTSIAIGGGINRYVFAKLQSFLVHLDVNALHIKFWNGSTYVGASMSKVFSVGVDYKIAIARVGDHLYMYCDGVLLSSTSGWLNFAIPENTNPLQVGKYGDGISYFNGYLDNIRITTGVARYTRAYTPQIRHIAQPSTRDPFWSDVILSMSGDNLAENKGKTPTVTGVTVDTSVKRYGSGSLKKNNVSDKISFVSVPEFNLKKDAFTIELWYNPGSSVGTGRYLAAQFGAAGSRSWSILVGPSGTGAIQFGFSSDGSNTYSVGNAASVTVSTNTWYHIAAVRERNSNNFTLYVNGNYVASRNVGDVSLFNSSLPVTLFATDNENYESGYYIDDFRVSRFARYTSSFTPPTRSLQTT